MAASEKRNQCSMRGCGSFEQFAGSQLCGRHLAEFIACDDEPEICGGADWDAPPADVVAAALCGDRGDGGVR